MKSKTLAITVFVLLCIASIAQALYYYPRLPEQVVVHFGPSGQPDAWGSKLQLFIIYLVTVGVTIAAFLGTGLAMPKIPNALFNLPNKDYWLAPERRKQTLDNMLSPFLWMGSLTMLLLLDLFHQTFQVALGHATQLNHFWISMVIYLVLTTAWCIAFYRKFSKKES